MKDMEIEEDKSISKSKMQTLLKVSIVIGLGLVILIIVVLRWPAHVDTKMAKAEFQIKYLKDALEQYHKDYGRYPTTEEGLNLLTEQEGPDGNVYIIRILNDPWGYPYNYIYPGVHNKDHYDLWIYGADNALGGKDFNKDITNWDNRE